MDRREVIIYVAVFLFTLVMLWNDQSIILVLGVVLFTTLIAFTIHVIYPMAWETRMNRLDAFLRNKQHKPYIYIFYATANRLDEEVEQTIEKLMSDPRASKSTKANYQAAYGSYRKDMFTLRKAVREMRRSDYRTYYETILLTEEGNSERARAHLTSIKKEWMRFALLAEIERRLNHLEQAAEYASKAIQASRGVNRYIMTKEAERYYTKEQLAQ
ncbi:hypothetical protein HUB98_01720 [Paenibacillus barcinonensis]|uniref:Pentatricopeptide repeat protein n=1 Tax=Paenibacillus barcinonensis TaxID=198119 RepID=A0A2V4W109_PAEBA|nr:hypothetical protein [Paenibacillus barcinonensis]PYE48038.1 hypothetical protein DFQ00_110100 [Paenibacillus barcinonensis]QKS55152.1 hypothetical protein HUB98_01720 [Paenibacillus barcinonensis]